MEIKRIGVLSCAKICAAIYVLIGFIIGMFISAASLLEVGAGYEGSGGLLVGAFAIVAMPILYGIAGAIGGIIMAVLYNLVARFTGGLELKVVATEQA